MQKLYDKHSIECFNYTEQELLYTNLVFIQELIKDIEQVQSKLNLLTDIYQRYEEQKTLFTKYTRMDWSNLVYQEPIDLIDKHSLFAKLNKEYQSSMILAEQYIYDEEMIQQEMSQLLEEEKVLLAQESTCPICMNRLPESLVMSHDYH